MYEHVSACMYVHNIYPWRQEEDVRILEVQFQVFVSCPMCL